MYLWNWGWMLKLTVAEFDCWRLLQYKHFFCPSVAEYCTVRCTWWGIQESTPPPLLLHCHKLGFNSSYGHIWSVQRCCMLWVVRDVRHILLPRCVSEGCKSCLHCWDVWKQQVLNAWCMHKSSWIQAGVWRKWSERQQHKCQIIM